MDEMIEGTDNKPVPKGRSTTGRQCCPGCRCSTRFRIALLCSIGLCISFGIRCNMGVAILQMISIPYDSRAGPNITDNQPQRWSVGTIGRVDSSFFWGYLCAQIPGGYLASKYPANRIFGGAIAISAFLNLFIPGAIRVHSTAVIVVRILQGLVEGVTYPACHGIWCHWAPPLERSRLATISFCGSYAGVVIGMPLSGIIADYWGWAACFYIYGVFGMAWFVFWWFLSSDRPCNHKTISEEEKELVETSICASNSAAPFRFSETPWRCFLTSMPVYAIIVANFCQSWSFYLMIIAHPKYFKDAFSSEVAKSGTLSVLQHLVMAIIVPIGGHMADTLRKRRLLSTTSVRKIFNCGGFGLEAIFLVGVGYTKDTITAIACLTIAVGFSGFAISGFNINHLDIAPRYASILMGISNCVGTVAGMFCPILTEMLTHNGRIAGWERVFLVTGCINLFGIIFYALFASGEKQPWAEPPHVKSPSEPGCDLNEGEGGEEGEVGAVGGYDGGPLPPCMGAVQLGMVEDGDGIERHLIR